MSHLLREHAPITEAAWEPASTTRRASASRPRSAARKLVDFAGPHGWEHSATNLGRVDAARRRPSTASRRAQRRVLAAGRAARAVLVVARRAARRRPRRPGRRPRRRSTRPRSGSRRAENAPSSTAGRRPGSPASPRPRPHDPIALGDDCDALPAPRRAGRRGAAARGHRRARTASRSGPRRTRRVLETTEHGGYPLLDHLRKILGGPLVWAPGVDGAVVLSHARRRLPVRVRAGPLDRLRLTTTPTRCSSTSRRASASAWRRPRRRSRSRPERRPDV